MAQLIKLRDYVSRYEWNAYRYPSQYIRLKQENWQKTYQLWLDQELVTKVDTDQQAGSFAARDPLPTTEIELRQYFLDRIFPLQMKWATSTVSNVSFTHKKYDKDQTLKYFLQRFPDIYLLMYHPIFNIKNAAIDGDIILISPFGIEIIHLLERDPETIIMAGDDRTWLLEQKHVRETIISPLISLKRTEHIVKGILHREKIEFPVRKLILSRTNNIVFSSEPYQTSIIGKFQYEDWFNKKRRLTSLLKSEQLKVSEALLKYCLTTSVRRPEWEEETNVFTVDREE